MQNMREAHDATLLGVEYDVPCLEFGRQPLHERVVVRGVIHGDVPDLNVACFSMIEWMRRNHDDERD